MNNISTFEIKRSLCVGWLSYLINELKCNQITLHTSVILMDKYMVNIMNFDNLRPIAATCLFIASKIEEKTPLDPAKIINMCDDSCNTSTMYELEKSILKSIHYNVYHDSSIIHIKSTCVANGIDRDTYEFARLMAGLTLTTTDYIHVDPILMSEKIIKFSVEMINATIDKIIVDINYFTDDLLKYLFCHLMNQKNDETVSIVP